MYKRQVGDDSVWYIRGLAVTHVVYPLHTLSPPYKIMLSKRPQYPFLSTFRPCLLQLRCTFTAFTPKKLPTKYTYVATSEPGT